MMQLKAYLERIGLVREDLSPSPELLADIQAAHIYSVPYENLDIIRGVPISLRIEDIYRKIVERRRGGYCFELNSALSWLLSELGFHVESYFARFLRGETEIPVRRHRVLGVYLGKERYVVDVGIGSPAPRFPLLLREGLVQEGFSESYRFQREEGLGWVLYELRHGEWQRYFSFTEEPQLDIDFIQPSFYCEKHPDSIFNRAEMVAIKTPTGRRSLDGRTYKEFSGAELSLIKEGLSDEELVSVLREKFGIILD